MIRQVIRRAGIAKRSARTASWRAGARHENILKFRASEEAVKQMGDVAIYHRLRFACYNKWVHIPAPVAIEEHVSGEYFLQFATCCGFADTHGAAYDYKAFHKVDYLIENYA